MAKLSCSIFISSNNSFTFFFIYIKVSKDSLAKYKKIKKKSYKKKLLKDIKAFLKKKKKNSNNVVVKDTKTYWMMKNKSLLSS